MIHNSQPLNERIRELRKKAGYSQQQMARKLHLTQGAISQWESGITVPVPPILRPFLSDLKGFAVTSANGSIMSETAFQRGWKSFLHALSIAAGHPVSIRAHDLRHTYCTMLRDAGVDIHQAIIWMGHADEKMILRIYDHPGRTREEEAKTRLNFAFGMQNGMQNQDGPAKILYL